MERQGVWRPSPTIVDADKDPFDHGGLDLALVRAVDAIGDEAPTPIQREAIPAILSNRNVIGRARQTPGIPWPSSSRSSSGG